ncbi:MAG: pepA 1 [Gammaproteobacteria bacterium]|jgi:leucyl aminopeptidase|nr:pepA 1 [Gammaproteobacteria bacterium]
MKFSLDSTDVVKQQTDCIIIGLFEQADLPLAAKQIDKISQNYLTKLLNQGDFQAKIGRTLFLHHVPSLSSPRVLLVGCGNKTTLRASEYQKIVMSSIKALNTVKIQRAISFLTELPVEQRDLPWKIKQTAAMTAEACYCFDQFKSNKEFKPTLQEMHLYAPKNEQYIACQTALKQILGINSGVEFTKNLANLPSNICTPPYLATQAKKLSQHYKRLTVKILEESAMAKLGMGALLAVSKGSVQPAKLICLEYHGSSKKQAPIVLVGKGITFDTGGLSLKSPDGMVGMKYDMCGAATVLGTLKAAAELKLPLHLVGVIAAVENMPSGSATKPEDIVTSLSGQTIEIMNTDAEGRLILCDALTYSERYKPAVVIDIATLTGAVVVALGQHATGLLSNYQPLAQDLLDAGIESHDRAWQLPLWEDYQEQLKSPFADISNVGGKQGSAITAACFLSRFAKKFHWAHLDVAGTAAMMMGGGERCATGRPVPLLMHYLINQSKK